MINSKVEKIILRHKDKRAIVFIDDANMFYAQRRAGWKIDWSKFSQFIHQYFEIIQIRYYMGIYPDYPEFRGKRSRIEKFAKKLERLGFQTIQRPLKKIFDDHKEGEFHFKCDFDAQMGFDIGFLSSQFDLAIVVSGDSDFVWIDKELRQKGKQVLFFCYRELAPWEIYRATHIFFEEIRSLVELAEKKNTPTRG